MPILNMIYGATGSGPTPEIWATNLVGYRPLQSDANDHKADVGASGTTYDGTWSGTATYGAVSGRTGASFSAIVSNYSINTRYNIVVTTDGSGTIKYYLNGSLIGTKSGGQDITGYNWCIARGIGNYCNGAYMSHCAIWEKELDASEISAFNTYINS